jgi:hypothetical protein
VKIEAWNLVVASNTLQSAFEMSQWSILKFRKVSLLEVEHTLKPVDRAPNEAETCAVLQRRYTAVRYAVSAQNINRHWQNWSWSSVWVRGSASP